MTAKVAILCDASRYNGSGHVMRQITLSQALIEAGIRVEMLCHEIPDPLLDRARDRGILVKYRPSVQTARDHSKAVQEAAADLVIFDGYNFMPQAIETVRGYGGVRTVVFDDNGDHANVECDVILNQNMHANSEMYRRGGDNRLVLLGLQWVLIRDEVATQSTRNWSERAGVFVSVGGTDPLGLTESLVSAARKVCPKVEWSSGLMSVNSSTPAVMASKLAEAKVGLIACGTTTWEAAFLGLPMVGLVVAQNQFHVAESLRKANLADSFDCRSKVDYEPIMDALSKLLCDENEAHNRSIVAKSLVDGEGARRVVRQLCQLF